VSELKISQKEKQELQNQIDSLTVKYPPITLNDLNTFSGTLSGISNISSRGIKIGPVAGISAILSKTKCSLCGKPIKPSALDNFCEDCKKTLLTAK
jgi:Zn finger protein HypA/HybF involved in hydrogenase expression